MKRTNLFSRLILSVVVIICFISCGKKSEYTNVIPVDAQAVVSLDLKSLAGKSGLKENKALKTKLSDLVKEGLNTEAMQYVDRVMNNPAESGIAFEEKIYYFLSQTKRQGITGKVSDINKLKVTFDWMNNQYAPLEYIESSGDGYELIFINGRDFCAFNKNQFLLLTGINSNDADDAKAEIEQLMLLSDDENFTSKKEFVKMNEKKKDISAVLSMNVLPGEYTRMMRMYLPERINLDDMKMITHLNFERGKIAFSYESYTENEELKKINDQYNTIISKMNTGFADYFPATLLYYYAMNMNGMKMYELLSLFPEYKEVFDSVLKPGSLARALGSIQGDIAFGVNNDVSIQTIPQISLYANVVNNEIINVVNESTNGMSVRTGEDTYSISLGMGINLYYGIQDKLFYLTTDATVANAIGQKVENSVKNTKWASAINNSMVYTYLNIKDIVNLPLWGLMGNSQEIAMAKMFLSKFDYLELASPAPNQTEMNISMVNQDENGLSQLISLGEQFIDGFY